MRGFPEFLNTKEDYLNLIEEYPEQTIRRLKDLLRDRYMLGFDDINPKIVKKEPHNCLYFVLGFTEEEIISLIEKYGKS